jgi:hypothetical protein
VDGLDVFLIGIVTAWMPVVLVLALVLGGEETLPD